MRSTRMIGCVFLLLGMAEAATGQPTEKRPADRPVRKDLYGDPLPPGAIARLGTVRFRSSSAFNLAVSPNGKIVATGGGFIARRVALWNLENGKRMRLTPHPRVSCLAFSRDGRFLAAADTDSNCLLLWELKSRQRQQTIPIRFDGSEARPCSIAFSKDSKLIALGLNSHSVAIYETNSGRLVRRLDGGDSAIVDKTSPGCDMNHIAFSDDQTQIVGASDHAICVWNLVTGKARLMPGRCLCISLDGKTVATSNGKRTVQFWEAATGKRVGQFDGPAPRVVGGCFSPDGKTMAVSRSARAQMLEIDSIHLVEVPTGKAIRVFRDHQSGSARIALSLDGKVMVSSVGGVASLGPNAIRVWDVATGKRVHDLPGHEAGVSHVAFSPNGTTIATGSWDWSVLLWNARTGRACAKAFHHQGSVAGLEFSRDGEILASAGGTTVCMSSPRNGKVKKVIGGDHFVEGIAWNQRNLLAASNSGRTLKIWDGASGREVVTLPSSSILEAWSADSRFFVSGRISSLAQIVDSSNGKQIRSFSDGSSLINSMALSPDDKCLALALYHEIQFMDIRSGKMLFNITNINGPIREIRYSPDGKLLALASKDQTVSLWETASRQRIAQLFGHRAAVQSVAFSPDMALLASGSDDTTTLVWDLANCIVAANGVSANWTETEQANLWAGLAHKNASIAQRATWTLSSSHKQGIDVLAKHLRPTSPLHSAPGELIARLSDLDFNRRQEAYKDLLELGKEIEVPVREALQKNPSLETRRRLEALLQAMEDRRSTPEELRRLRALQALEHIGTAKARELLRSLAAGDRWARQTREAQASLQRLAERDKLGAMPDAARSASK